MWRPISGDPVAQFGHWEQLSVHVSQIVTAWDLAVLLPAGSGDQWEPIQLRRLPRRLVPTRGQVEGYARAVIEFSGLPEFGSDKRKFRDVVSWGPKFSESTWTLGASSRAVLATLENMGAGPGESVSLDFDCKMWGFQLNALGGSLNDAVPGIYERFRRLHGARVWSSVDPLGQYNNARKALA